MAESKDNENSEQSSSSSTPSLKKPETKKSEALWMMTFSDMSFILMCFFALLLSFSKPNKNQFENVVEGMVKEKKYDPKKPKNLSELEKLIRREIKRRKLAKS